MGFKEFSSAATLSPQLLESGSSYQENWENLTCNSRYSIRATAYYLKYVEYKYYEELGRNPGFYTIMTPSAAYSSGHSISPADGYQRDNQGRRLLPKSALLSTGYTEGVDEPDMMQQVMRNEVSANGSGFGGPDGGGGAFNTTALMPLATRFYCGGGSVYSCG